MILHGNLLREIVSNWHSPTFEFGASFRNGVSVLVFVWGYLDDLLSLLSPPLHAICVVRSPEPIPLLLVLRVHGDSSLTHSKDFFSYKVT